MLEFESFVYLDVHKTGSSFIVSILKAHSKEKEIRLIRHEGVGAFYDSSKFHFISLRNPLDQYISLYSFGCDKNGLFRQRLNKLGHGNLYSGTWNGFRSWLAFVLHPANARLLNEEYASMGSISDIIGYQSYRVLGLALRHRRKALTACKTRDDVIAAYRTESIVDHIVRAESLRTDLADLLCTKLKDSILDLDAALKHIQTESSRNRSLRIDRFLRDPKLGNRLTALLHEREWPFYELFGYEKTPNVAATSAVRRPPPRQSVQRVPPAPPEQ